MDNTQGVPPAALSQGQPQPVTSQVPNDTQSGAVVGTAPEAPASEAGTQANENMILGKFKSQEDLVKAYQNLESHNKKVEQDAATKTRTLEELDKMFTTEPQAAPGQEAAEMTAEDPMKTLVEELRPKLRSEFGQLLGPVVAKLEVRDMVDRYGQDFVANATAVQAIKAEKPYLSLEDAYKLHAFQTIARSAKTEGVAQAQQAQELAARAQLESTQPSGARPVTVEEAIQNPGVPLTEVFDAMGPEFKSFAEESRRRAGKR